MFLGLVAARLKIEFAYYKMVDCLSKFVDTWDVNEVLCTLWEQCDGVDYLNMYVWEEKKTVSEWIVNNCVN